MKITSSGIIYNEDKPRIGITSNAHPEFLDEFILEGVDLSWEEYIEDIKDELKTQGLTDEEIETRLEDAWEGYSHDGGSYLLGAWVKNANGEYTIDTSGKHGTYAASYNNENGDIVSVEWSTLTKRCHHTSLCYTMADGSGPCGDLDTEGDSVLAYTLPDDCFNKEGS